MRDIRSGRAAALTAGAAICLLALAGCATPSAVPGATGAPTSMPETSAPAETPSAEPTPTQEPQPQPAPTEPTPTEEPADPSDVAAWVVTETAIGPFTLGMPWSEAVAKATELGWNLEYAEPDPNGGCAVNVHMGGPAGSESPSGAMPTPSTT